MIPPADAPVHVVNSFYERQADGTWKAWIEPLGGDEPKQRLFERSGPDVDAARDAMGLAYVQHLSSLDGEGRQTWYQVHAVQVPAHRTFGDRPWPPPSGFCRNLDGIDAG